MHSVLERISSIGIVPVVRIDDVKTALPLAKALCAGGLPCAEITFRTAQAEEAIRLISESCPDMLVGAGTVLTTEQVDRAVAAGAKFIVSPGLNPNIVKYCAQKGVPITPGTANASDIEAALELGLEVVKFFPAEVNGGIKAIKALAAPYTQVKFMPTGGVSEKNLNDYLSFEKVIACGGSWMVDPSLLAAENYSEIERLTREAVHTMLGFELAHIGVNSPDEKTAAADTSAFSALLGMPVKEGKGGFFVGTIIEVLKAPYLGEKGHIAIRTNSLIRAIAYLEAQGFKFREDSKKYDSKGKFTAIYFENEIAGFSLHLLQK